MARSTLSLTIAASVVIAMALSACGGRVADKVVPSTEGPSAPAVESGWSRATLSDNSASFSMPDRFTEIDLSGDDVLELLDTGSDNLNADLAALANEMAAQDGFLYWAFDFETAEFDFVPNVNALTVPAGPLDTVAIYVQALSAQYAALGIDVTRISEIETRSGTGVAVEIVVPQATGSSAGLQLLVPTDDDVWTVTYSVATLTDDLRQEFMSSFETFQIHG